MSVHTGDRFARIRPLLLLALATFISAGHVAAALAAETVLYRFKGGSDGAGPLGALIQDADGALYGTTHTRGSPYGCDGFGCGTVFKLTPPVAPSTAWTRTELHHFRGPERQDGADPRAGVIFDRNGALYGTTLSGGGAGYSGTVFKLTPPTPPATKWVETVLHRFTDGAVEGFSPFSGLIIDEDGALYGTTTGGGAGGRGGRYYGTVFKLIPPTAPATTWTHVVLHDFRGGADGGYSQSGLVMDEDGALYGTTGGGPGSDGTAFKLTPSAEPDGPWTMTVLHRFRGGRDGFGALAGLVRDPAGSLYGTTIYGGKSSECSIGLGCGTVFRLTPPTAPETEWTRTILYRFRGSGGGASDGAFPYAGLTLARDGALYGATSEGGRFDYGTVFKLSPPTPPATQWTRTLLHSFRGPDTKDGGNPISTMHFDGTALYGTTLNYPSFGVVFKVE